MSTKSTAVEARLPLHDQKRIDAICDRFEAAWSTGGRPDLAAFLAELSGPARNHLFRDLLALDLEYRGKRGEHPVAGDYSERFPEHAADVAAAFMPTFRSGDLSPGAPVDPTVENVNQPMSPGAEGSAPASRDREATESLATAGYEVLGELGQGGMGVVYKAKHVALNRLVALKLIRPDRFTSEADRRRFRNEAEAVAMLDHPNIVTIYEVGRSGTHDYFSMKFVPGVSLDQRLASGALDPRAAAELVAVTAEAVHHAHQRGILHRDLKPANILLDESGAPHVADFGLAKRVEAGVELTHSGTLVGTPAYMSPEQVEARGALTTATDVYGLGSILYALLTGRAPFAGSTVVETLVKVREDLPEPPSKHNVKVPRDLEVICLKCLEKEPQRRYGSALALSEDLTRWLAGEPIEARPVGSLARAGMWCRRHPLPAGLAASLALAVVVGLLGVSWKWREAARERATGEQINEFLVNKLLANASDDLLDRASERLGGDFEGRPEVEAVVREKIGLAYFALGHYDKAEPHLRAAASLFEGLHGPRDRSTLRVANTLASLLDESGRFSEAETLARQTLETSRAALGPNDAITLDSADNLGVILRHIGKLDEAETTLRATLATRRRILEAGHEDTLRSVNHLGLLLQDRAQLAEADTLANEYENGVRCLWGTKHPDNVVAQTNLGYLRLHQGRSQEAEAYFQRAVDDARRILGPEHPKTHQAETLLTRIRSQNAGG